MLQILLIFINLNFLKKSKKYLCPKEIKNIKEIKSKEKKIFRFQKKQRKE